MEIDSSLKQRDLPQYVRKHLLFLDTWQVKSSVSGMTLILFDLFIIIPLLYPMIGRYLYLILPLIAFINLWMVRLLIKNPYSTQLETVLFIGSFGAISSFCFFILSQKMAYFYMGILSVGYYIITTLIFLCVVTILIFYQINKYKHLNREDQQKGSNKTKYGLLIVLAPAAGYILAQYTNHSEALTNSILVIFFYFFAGFYSYVAAKFFHKYFFMNTNMHLVHFQKPMKKDRKEFKKKGIVIK